eukprot:2691906-Rhodomonas_salina.1
MMAAQTEWNASAQREPRQILSHSRSGLRSPHPMILLSSPARLSRFSGVLQHFVTSASLLESKHSALHQMQLRVLSNTRVHGTMRFPGDAANFSADMSLLSLSCTCTYLLRCCNHVSSFGTPMTKPLPQFVQFALRPIVL